jgi:choline-sulfatase
VAADLPDVVLFLTDQQRFDQVGYAESTIFETPALDALAARGVVFDQAYSPATTCVPARSALMTGMQPHRLRTQINGVAIREGTPTLARALRAHGYQTALVGKMHFAPLHAEHGFDTMRLCEHLAASAIVPRADGRLDLDDYHDWLLAQGLSEYRQLPPDLTSVSSDVRPFPYEVGSHPTSWVEREAHEVLDARDPDRPLFLVVSFPHPHSPLDPPEPYASMYDPADVVVPRDGFEVNDGLPDAFIEALSVATAPYRPRRVDSDRPAAVRAWLTKVRALVRQIDDAMGRLLERLPLDRTLMFFTSDHGDYAGHRGLLQKVPWIPFDDLVRVPLVVAGPGVAGGRRVTSLVQSYDIVATVGEAVEPDSDRSAMDAVSLWPHLCGDDASHDDRLAVFATRDGWPGARRGSLKYFRQRSSGQGVLFDLAVDPGETRNLVDHPDYRDAAFELAVGLKMILDREMVDA